MASANTPDPPNNISMDDIRSVFGKGRDVTPFDDLNDFHGVPYFEVQWPYRAGKFNVSTNGKLEYHDFYSKTATDPIVPGYFYDDVPGGAKTYRIPAFRRYVKIESWGGGGGAGSGDHDSVRPPGGAGSASMFSTSSGASPFSVTVGGGAPGTGGYRYGNQNGTGGAGGVVSVSGTVVGTQNFLNGSSGGNGNAGNGEGGYGGTPPGGASQTPPYGPGAGGRAGRLADGNIGLSPGGGGGAGGSSDFQSGKNANPNRAAGGGGGSGGYASLVLTRNQIEPGMLVQYDVGSGGHGSTGNEGNGAPGAGGGFKISWDYPLPKINYQTFLIDDWVYHFNGCYGVGYNDVVIAIGSSAFTYAGKTVGSAGGIILSVTGAAADYTVASPGRAGRWSPNGHTAVTDGYIYNSVILLDGDPIRTQTTNWHSVYADGRDNMAFRAITNWSGSALTVSIQGDGKGGTNNGPTIGTATPVITYI